MVNIRPFQKGEEWFLREMLYEAIFTLAIKSRLPNQ
jgi:hypothetical protein